MADETPHSMTNQRVFYWLIAIFILLGIFYLGYWWFYSRFFEWTDDAYVNGNKVVVTPQIPGIVTTITTDNTHFVEKGRVLITLDRTDPKIALDKAIFTLANAVRDVVLLNEQAQQLSAQLPGAKAEFIKAAQDYEHRKHLVKEGGVSLEDFQHAQAYLESAYSTFVSLEHQALGAFALIENTTVETHPIVEEAKAKLRDAYVNYQRCSIEAPVSGLVAQRTVQVGEWVEPGRPLLSIIPLDQMWIDANYKEIQLSKVRIGQPAKVKTDLYGGSILFKGTVVGIAGGTGSIFSVLPPQNATGNWIKIVQRLPVRIQLDPEEIIKFPLRLGLSVETTIDLHDTQIPMIPSSLPQEALYSTDVFENQEEGVEELINQIIADNFFLENEEGITK